jgi:UPF0716 protein FxsA
VRLFLLFTIVPLVDLWLLLRIGRAIGFWPSLAIVVLTGVAGAALARAEGFRVLRSWQASLAAGRLPEEGVLSGVLVLAGAALLVAPGFLTDLAGLGLLFPPTRRLAAAGVRRWIRRRVDEGRVRVVTFGPGGSRGDGSGFAGPPRGEGPVIDVTPGRGPDDAGRDGRG